MSAKPQAYPSAATDTDGNLLLLITAVLYGVFTILPNSTTQMVTWPWVALWQALLLLPMLWLLWQVWYKPLKQLRLGNGFDWLAGLVMLGIVLSTLFAEFPQQARWYAIAALAGLAALYGLVSWLTPTRANQLLKAQAYLAIAFIIVSLGLWLTNTYLPELERLDLLQAIGISRSFNFERIALRNGFPLGHQNYVAGYLVLILPLLAGLAWSDKTAQRWVWVGGLGLGLLALYTTSSRGGVLALVALILPALVGLLLNSRFPRKIVIPASLLGFGLLSLLILTNPRLQLGLTSLRRGGTVGSQVAYRLITNTIGWRMGAQQPWSGQGLGSVPHLYQQFRPVWAGREAELHHQLHSTPAQLWAELGIWGIGLPLLGGVLLVITLWRRRQAIAADASLPASLLWSLVSGLWAYGVMSLTDYQLDVIAISGVIVIYLAVILVQLRPVAPAISMSGNSRWQRGLAGIGLGLFLALSLWLVPIHQAWAASAQGFWELQRENLPAFVAQLQRSQRLAPWESYYPYQLGWTIGDLSLQVEDPQLVEQTRSDAIAWFQQANAVSPHQEFGYSNLGWLQTASDPAAATASFAQAAQLVPAKMGVFFGLGYSLLLNNQPALAAEAMALEIIRHPRTLTSSIWMVEPFSTLYPAVIEQLDRLYEELLAIATDPILVSHLHQIRGTTHWWTGNFEAAAADWAAVENAVGLALLTAASGERPDMAELPESAGKYALQAWFEPANRESALAIAWATQPEDAPTLSVIPPAAQIEALADTMTAATTFDEWLKEAAPTVEVRNERLGFGVFRRHDDGPSPMDYYTRLENVAIAKFFDPLVPSPVFMPALDEPLQTYRAALLQRLAS